MSTKEFFHRQSERVATAMGNPWAFIAAVVFILLWVVSGPVFGFSDTWQLIINTGTTIITFLMVFLIQNSQNRGSEALQIKLDELIRATRGARDTLIDLEDLSDEELEKMHKEFQRVRSARNDASATPNNKSQQSDRDSENKT